MSGPVFFATPARFASWLAMHHATSTELLVGFHKKDSGHPSITWPEAVAEALCVGWIDGIRKRIDDTSYMIRFTPRKPSSNWSAINVDMVGRLIAEGRMQPAGLAAFERRHDARTSVYSYEQRKTAKLTAAHAKVMKANRAAWEYYQAQPPGYRRTAAWWVISAKQESTRQRRLEQLIECSAQGCWIAQLRRTT